MSRQRTMAPRRTPSGEIVMSRNCGSLRRSTSRRGEVRRNASMGIRLCPPAIGFASPSLAARSATASDRLVGHAYSSGGGFMSLGLNESQHERICFEYDSDCLLGQRSRLLRIVYQLPDARRRERQLTWRDTKRSQRVRDRVGDHAADRNDTALTGALGSERIVRRRVLLERDRTNVRKIIRGRQQIVGKRAGQQLSILVIDQLFEQRSTESLHDRADRLPMERYRIDDAANVLHRHIFDHVHTSAPRIDGDVGRVRAVTVGPLAAGVARLLGYSIGRKVLKGNRATAWSSRTLIGYVD